jgi:hypothetical protein
MKQEFSRTYLLDQCIVNLLRDSFGGVREEDGLDSGSLILTPPVVLPMTLFSLFLGGGVEGDMRLLA